MLPPAEPLYRFTLLQPLSANNLYRNVPGLGRRKTRAYKAWIAEAGWLAKLDVGAVPEPLSAPIRMAVSGVERIDLDNIKAIPDLCKRLGLIRDDKLISRLEVDRGPGPIIVSIWPL